MESRCPQCGSERGDGTFVAYTPGVACPRCGLVHQDEVEHVDGAPPDEPTKVSASEAPMPSPPEGTEDTPPPEGGVLLKLVPKTQSSNVEHRRSVCRKILLDTLQRVEAGEVDELFLFTINSRMAPSPVTYRWNFTDPIRITGALTVAVTKFSMPPFVSIT